MGNRFAASALFVAVAIVGCRGNRYDNEYDTNARVSGGTDTTTVVTPAPATDTAISPTTKATPPERTDVRVTTKSKTTARRGTVSTTGTPTESTRRAALKLYQTTNEDASLVPLPNSPHNVRPGVTDTGNVPTQQPDTTSGILPNDQKDTLMIPPVNDTTWQSNMYQQPVNPTTSATPPSDTSSAQCPPRDSQVAAQPNYCPIQDTTITPR
ncbi:MAG: hypothetical protein HY700_08950 [Gemmatimonadetes bacterium]|nr:hypothetical protein [Gemmatimonadota bacterium]